MAALIHLVLPPLVDLPLFSLFCYYPPKKMEESRLPAGLKEQIDDLDTLLDQLLKLPIDRVQAAPATLPLKPRASVKTVHEEPEKSILRFHEPAEVTKPTLTLADESEWKEEEEEQEVEVSENVEKPSLVQDFKPNISLAVQEDNRPESHSDTSSRTPLTPNPSPRGEEGSQTSLPVEEIPWIDDEPLPGVRGKGPVVEIIQGPSSDIVVSSRNEEARPSVPAPRRRSWIFWLFWMVTWCFDHTLGNWFPWLRRPNVKFLLGLVGVALFAVSIYLVWAGWLR